MQAAASPSLFAPVSRVAANGASFAKKGWSSVVAAGQQPSRMWLVWLAVGLAALALILGIAALSRKGSSSSPSSYSARCAATLASSSLSQIDMLNNDMPAAARATWLTAAGTPMVSGDLPPQFGTMTDGSPLPNDLMCQLLAGCTAGRWAQVTPAGNCYNITDIASGWSTCSPTLAAHIKPLGAQLAISCPV